MINHFKWWWSAIRQHNKWQAEEIQKAMRVEEITIDRKKKMTKDEALTIVADARMTNGHDGDMIFINRLEALGLIKFDEPKDELNELREKFSYAIDVIEQRGYKIVKAD